MADPIPLMLPQRDPRADLLHKLQNAPQEHAEALLDAYAILQELHDKGLLEIAKGLLGSGEKVLTILTETMESEAIIRTIRNFSILLKIVGSLDPEMLENLALVRPNREPKGKRRKVTRHRVDKLGADKNPCA